jgi:hypothetical protein
MLSFLSVLILFCLFDICFYFSFFLFVCSDDDDFHDDIVRAAGKNYDAGGVPNAAQELDMLKRKDIQLAESLDKLYSDKFMQEVMAMPQGIDADELTADQLAYILTAILMYTNNHRPQHTKSCFKESVRTKFLHAYLRVICRYLVPHHRKAQTTFQDGMVLLRRLLGSEYINGFNFVTAIVLRCNHDFQVGLGDMLAAIKIIYSHKYTFKDLQSVENQTAVALASLIRRHNREQEDAANAIPITDEQKARRRIAALMLNLTDKFEISMPMACLYLLNGQRTYHSHEFNAINLAQMLNAYEKERIQRRVIGWMSAEDAAREKAAAAADAAAASSTTATSSATTSGTATAGPPGGTGPASASGGAASAGATTSSSASTSAHITGTATAGVPTAGATPAPPAAAAAAATAGAAASAGPAASGGAVASGGPGPDLAGGGAAAGAAAAGAAAGDDPAGGGAPADAAAAGPAGGDGAPAAGGCAYKLATAHHDHYLCRDITTNASLEKTSVYSFFSRWKVVDIPTKAKAKTDAKGTFFDSYHYYYF